MKLCAGWRIKSQLFFCLSTFLFSMFVTTYLVSQLYPGTGSNIPDLTGLKVSSTDFSEPIFRIIIYTKSALKSSKKIFPTKPLKSVMIFLREIIKNSPRKFFKSFHKLEDTSARSSDIDGASYFVLTFSQQSRHKDRQKLAPKSSDSLYVIGLYC